MRYSFFDKLCLQFDSALRTLTNTYPAVTRDNPARTIPETELTEHEKKHSAALMRVNHVGEICAQALYQGQALTAKLPTVREQMQHAANEEQDHLSWCRQRINELESHTSYLNPLWYLGAFTIGAIAGVAGDRWSLGFVAETEHQVVEHLQGHLTKLTGKDQKTHAILKQMTIDEAQHADTAIAAGAAELPKPIKLLMRSAAKVMTTTAYWI